ncbi:MAG: M28 family peptidase [Muribaculaceae bacterium]|nr:M28 family peptidase [Muribaculaceae bacterium]
MKITRHPILTILCALAMVSCGASRSGSATDSAALPAASDYTPAFNADSAYSYVKSQVDMGPRVPNTPAHRRASAWLADELRRHGASVTLQPMQLKAFDGTLLDAVNVFGQFNPGAERRILLLAHYDCRPWADNDPDPDKHTLPVDGANDGASGVGVILELARLMGQQAPDCGVDILFADAEDWGNSGDDSSWALGTRYFAGNPPVADYAPDEAILLDMVGAPDAVFPHEIYSLQNAPGLVSGIWATAASLGLEDRFISQPGGAINDDHVELLKAGIPAVDIIDLRPEGGFPDRWHTTSDNMEGISAQTLGDVGRVIETYIRTR